MFRLTIFRHLYFQVLLAIALGALLGHYQPDFAMKLKPLGDGFIRLVKMVIAPIIFTTVVVGMAGMGNVKRLGRIGLKALIYFEVVTTFALVIGWIVVKAVQPGAGFNADASTLDTKLLPAAAVSAKATGTADFLLSVIPESIVGAFAQGNILQVLVFSVLFGLAISGVGAGSQPVIHALDQISHALLRMIGMIIKLAPLAAFGAMAFTVGKFGLESLANLGKLVACVYLTSFCFIFFVLGAILRCCGIGLWDFLRFIREEIFIVLGTASSESVLPRMMARMEQLGCSKPLVGLVLPAGYSFNLDGTSIYLTMGALFIAQATNTPLTFLQEATLLGVCLLTSKGSAAVTGGAFITLAATLSSLEMLPVSGLVLIVGVDRILSEVRAITNLIGNGVAMIVIAKWDGEFDTVKANEVLRSRPAPE